MKLPKSALGSLVIVSCATLLLACGGPGTGTSAVGTGGAPAGTGGSGSGGAGGSGGAATGEGGLRAGSGGARAGTGGAATGGGGALAGTGGAGGAPVGCGSGVWPAADPSLTGPFAITTENNVGPGSAFTLIRPTNLAQGGLCHPVVTWGNGTGTTPNIYAKLLDLLASHGFVVIASNSMNVAQGDPPPMLDGVTWVVQQNDDPTSALYHQIDTAHIGATGHSQGAFATVTAGADARIVTIAPIAGATPTRNLHGPALLLCGGLDTTVPCSTVLSAFNGITNQPVMYASQLAADHINWIGFGGGAQNPYVVAVNAWMRVQLMGDATLRSMFYGPTCTLCTDTAVWQVMQKMMN